MKIRYCKLRKKYYQSRRISHFVLFSVFAAVFGLMLSKGCEEPAGENAGGGEPYRVNVAGLRSSGEADIRRMSRAEVIGHVDGDTVHVRFVSPPQNMGAVETIRILGVDTPETVHPNRPVEHFGKEASDYTKTRLLNQPVRLAFDWDLRDRYGRLLAYIYTEDGVSCFNAELIREGYAHAYTNFTFQFADEFRALEQDARRAGRGLWQQAAQ